jgi:hypothetical protein
MRAIRGKSKLLKHRNLENCFAEVFSDESDAHEIREVQKIIGDEVVFSLWRNL